jgi:hypothetical protein
MQHGSFHGWMDILDRLAFLLDLRERLRTARSLGVFISALDTETALVDWHGTHSSSMDFLNKAKQAAGKYSGGDSSHSSSSNNKKSDSLFSKAKDAAEKYHAKEKAAEFAQKRVATREQEKHQPGYVQKDRSTVDKAVEAAEDFLAKQGQSKLQHGGEKKTDNQTEDLFGKAKDLMGKYNKKH